MSVARRDEAGCARRIRRSNGLTQAAAASAGRATHAPHRRVVLEVAIGEEPVGGVGREVDTDLGLALSADPPKGRRPGDDACRGASGPADDDPFDVRALGRGLITRRMRWHIFLAERVPVHRQSRRSTRRQPGPTRKQPEPDGRFANGDVVEESLVHGEPPAAEAVRREFADPAIRRRPPVATAARLCSIQPLV